MGDGPTREFGQSIASDGALPARLAAERNRLLDRP
jgi:hypothetical protein